MKQIIIDSGVFIKLVINEAYSNKAYEIRDAYISKNINIIVPSLFVYEVLNVLKYSKSFNKNELEFFPEILENYGFGIFNISIEFAKSIIRIALKYNITIYDAAYVALAITTNSIFYTADEKLIKAVKSQFIKHMKEFQ